MIQILENAGFVAADRFLVQLVDLIGKSLMLVVVAWIAAKLLCNKSASQRNFVWLLAVAGLAVLPILEFAPAAPWRLPANSDAGYRAPASINLSQPRPFPISQTTQINRKSPGLSPSLSPNDDDHAAYRNLVKNAIITAWPPNDFVRAAIAVWLFGALFYLLNFCYSLSLLRRVYRLSRPALTQQERAVFNDSLVAARVNKTVELRIAGDSCPIAVPITWGFIRPVIVLPASSTQWNELRLRAALLHEISHIARADWLARFAGNIVGIAYWCNPLVWIALRKMGQECETASDDLVLSSGIPAQEYAKQLLATAKDVNKRTCGPIAAIAMIRLGNLESRLRAILNSSTARSQTSRTVQLTAFLVAALTVFGISHYRFCFAAGNVAIQNTNVPASENSPSAGDDSGEKGYEVGDGNDAVVAPSQTSAVDLANGATVRLIDVSDSQSATPRCWDPRDGFALPASISGQPVHFRVLPTNTKGRAFRFEISAVIPPASQAFTFFKHNSPPLTPLQNRLSTQVMYKQYEGWYARIYKNYSLFNPSFLVQYIPNDHLDEQYPNVEDQNWSGKAIVSHLTYSEAFNSWRKLARLRIAVATGPYTNIVEFFPKAGQQTNNHEYPVVTVGLAPGRTDVDGETATIVSITDNLSSRRTLHAFTDFDRKLICRDASGAVIGVYGLEFNSADQNLNFTDAAGIPDSIFRRIASFDFVARPYDWVEYKNVKLDAS